MGLDWVKLVCFTQMDLECITITYTTKGRKNFISRMKLTFNHILSQLTTWLVLLYSNGERKVRSQIWIQMKPCFIFMLD